MKIFGLKCYLDGSEGKWMLSERWGRWGKYWRKYKDWKIGYNCERKIDEIGCDSSFKSSSGLYLELEEIKKLFVNNESFSWCKYVFFKYD